MRIVALLTILLMVGCGGSSSDEAPDNHGYGLEFNSQGTTGMLLRHTPGFATSNPFLIDVTFWETRWAHVQACTGMSAPAPFIIIVPVGTLPQGTRGQYFSDPPLIVIDEKDWFVDKHEEIHYLLSYTTGDPDPNHLSPFFGACS